MRAWTLVASSTSCESACVSTGIVAPIRKEPGTITHAHNKMSSAKTSVSAKAPPPAGMRSETNWATEKISGKQDRVDPDRGLDDPVEAQQARAALSLGRVRPGCVPVITPKPA